MYNRHTFTLLLAVGCALSIYQLGNEPERRVAVVPESTVALPTEEKAPEAEVEKSPSEEPKAEELTVVEEQPLADQFEFPFPDRVNLFRAPQRQGKGIVKSNGKTETEIELLGFVNVDEQQVVLSVDGLVASLSEGSTEYGIEVISIQPPAVVLKRGRQRWQASLEN